MKKCAIAVFTLLCSSAFATSPAPTTKHSSAFFPAPMLERIRGNVANSDFGKELRDKAIAQAEPWMKMPDEQLRKLMFGATIERSWHVLSNGDCPACGKPMPMYDWKIDAIARPWK